MGCCASSPYTKRRYRDPADLDEAIVPLRHFGTFRNNSNVIPDDIVGLPSTHIIPCLATDTSEILYDVEIDQGAAFGCLRPIILCLAFPPCWVYCIPKVMASGVAAILGYFDCDQACCWVRKEYSTRRFIRVFSNRIEFNQPTCRLWGMFGCGSWNTDNIQTNPFDRGAFGFRPVSSGVSAYLCCLWPVYGGAVARQRCPCNGSLWPRMFNDCNGWWCDEWLCEMCFCSFKYYQIANTDETALACSIALQAYFEGRHITKKDMDRCIDYWRMNISEKESLEERRREVCCEPFSVPCCTAEFCYKYWSHPKRYIPYADEEMQTKALKEAYSNYEIHRQKQIKHYSEFEGPVRRSTLCRIFGCRRVFGRKGCCFCTEGCDQNCCSHKGGGPAPPFIHKDIDDENDASRILWNVLGDPPKNVVFTRTQVNQTNGWINTIVSKSGGNESISPVINTYCVQEGNEHTSFVIESPEGHDSSTLVNRSRLSQDMADIPKVSPVAVGQPEEHNAPTLDRFGEGKHI
mmetsp:Transcript_35186/g.51673  ORF Transcript_35186/g.51673 Transcript_35186/m.51673 type:complete len:518 (+) Transcript_35186:41-1594(+)|eukprot:CAMPEP_0195521344 /NCGR_PEP_ID=MMETSP0794_2-20130614/18493_1 /TAXON_ID=515487 /ORGANISM="Stephanopyxis turris, Strain CCMP 815" /LENGTH=517 /DNA_ID=CAMNT_0040650875 /DNA_START=36 /DNA_END=1589 /DNA_ORIENTATION=-